MSTSPLSEDQIDYIKKRLHEGHFIVPKQSVILIAAFMVAIGGASLWGVFISAPTKAERAAIAQYDQRFDRKIESQIAEIRTAHEILTSNEGAGAIRDLNAALADFSDAIQVLSLYLRDIAQFHSTEVQHDRMKKIDDNLNSSEPWHVYESDRSKWLNHLQKIDDKFSELSSQLRLNSDNP